MYSHQFYGTIITMMGKDRIMILKDKTKNLIVFFNDYTKLIPGLRHLEYEEL
jgi:hypothetical protein